MSRFSNGYYLNGLFWQIFRVSCLAALLSLILSSNTTLAANSQPESIKVSLTPVTLSVPLPQQQRIDEQSSLILNLEGIEYTPSNVIPYDIYLNLPPGVTPNTDSPYYAGTLALFAYPQGATYSLNITDAVRRLRNDHLLQNDHLSITIVPPKPEQFLTTAQLERSSPRLSEPVIRFKRVSITSNAIKN